MKLTSLSLKPFCYKKYAICLFLATLLSKGSIDKLQEDNAEKMLFSAQRLHLQKVLNKRTVKLIITSVKMWFVDHFRLLSLETYTF